MKYSMMIVACLYACGNFAMSMSPSRHATSQDRELLVVACNRKLPSAKRLQAIRELERSGYQSPALTGIKKDIFEGLLEEGLEEENAMANELVERAQDEFRQLQERISAISTLKKLGRSTEELEALKETLEAAANMNG